MKLFLTDFVFKFPGKNSRRYPNSDESVNQLRKVMGNFRSVLISQVDFARVREFIADDAASMEQVENICGCAKHVYLFNQRAFCAKAGFTFSGKIHHKLQAYTKEGASSASYNAATKRLSRHIAATGIPAVSARHCRLRRKLMKRDVY